MVVISDRKRQSAFTIWTETLNRYEIKLTDAGQPFRKRWVESPSQFSDELTVAADILWGISNNLTEKSVQVFTDKVRELVRCRRENDYLMCLSEMEVPALLVPRVSPIAFEPAVPRQADVAAKPPSSDHSVLLPSGEIFIEATTIDLRGSATDTEVILRRIKRKLSEKRYQAAKDRVYLLAMKVLGPPNMLGLVGQIVSDRVWPNAQFRRYGGLMCFAEVPGEFGAFQGWWLPNNLSVAPPAADVSDFVCGRRCFHLGRVGNIECSAGEIYSFRRKVAAGWSMHQGLAAPVRLVGGPLDDIEILLKPTQVGDEQITLNWYLTGKARAEVKPKGTIKEILIPPHGPIEVAYQRREDTSYVFAGFRLWIDEWRPSVPGSEYLLQLNIFS